MDLLGALQSTALWLLSMWAGVFIIAAVALATYKDKKSVIKPAPVPVLSEVEEELRLMHERDRAIRKQDRKYIFWAIQGVMYLVLAYLVIFNIHLHLVI